MSFRVLRPLFGPQFGRIDFFPGVKREWKLADGVRMGEDCPPDVIFDIHEDSGNIISDFVGNVRSTIIVSTRARALLEAEGLGAVEVEYLPVRIRNKNGIPVRATSFAIANVLRTLPCVDLERSRYSATDDGEIVVMDILHIDAAVVPPDVKLFRPAEYPKLFLFREDLIARIEQAGLTGFRSLPLGANLRDE